MPPDTRLVPVHPDGLGWETSSGEEWADHVGLPAFGGLGWDCRGQFEGLSREVDGGAGTEKVWTLYLPVGRADGICRWSRWDVGETRLQGQGALWDPNGVWPRKNQIAVSREVGSERFAAEAGLLRDSWRATGLCRELGALRSSPAGRTGAWHPPAFPLLPTCPFQRLALPPGCPAVTGPSWAVQGPMPRWPLSLGLTKKRLP